MGEPRRGLVLGAGGILGFSWMLGALHALAEVEGVTPAHAEVTIGTSAGSILSALLGAGVDVGQLIRHQFGKAEGSDPDLGFDYERHGGGTMPPRPGFGLGSAHLLLQTAFHPGRITPLAALSSVLPPGRGSLAPLGEAIGRVSAIGLAGAHWPEKKTWLVAMDYDTGRRVAFGRPGSPRARLAEAVMASCSVPGWYQPTTVNGRRYVDGGACSSTSLDLMAGWELDEVYVLAPMASFAMDDPDSVASRIERRFRRTQTRRLLDEAGKVRKLGTRVTLLGPGPEDLAAIGANLMDPRRRIDVLRTSLRSCAEALRRLSA